MEQNIFEKSKVFKVIKVFLNINFFCSITVFARNPMHEIKKQESQDLNEAICLVGNRLERQQ